MPTSSSKVEINKFVNAITNFKGKKEYNGIKLHGVLAYISINRNERIQIFIKDTNYSLLKIEIVGHECNNKFIDEVNLYGDVDVTVNKTICETKFLTGKFKDTVFSFELGMVEITNSVNETCSKES